MPIAWPLARLARRCARVLLKQASLALVLAVVPATGSFARIGDDTIVQARDALTRKDAQRLAAARAAVMATPAAERHPLAMWVEYWELGNRLGVAQQDELEAFYARWKGSYVEDRLRNDWLLELGRRGDWPQFTREFPRFRMNDDREVTCYAVLTDHLAGKPVRAAARAAWFAQRDADEGCARMARELRAAGVLSAADAWNKARLSLDANRVRGVRLAVELADAAATASLGDVLDSPAKYLARRNGANGQTQAELATLALMRVAAQDPEMAAGLLSQRWQQALPAELASWAWAATGRQAAFKLLPEAGTYYERARQRTPGAGEDWSPAMRAWAVRAALRSSEQPWRQVLAAMASLTPGEQADPTWTYWKARALKATAAEGVDGSAQRAEGHAMLMGLSEALARGQLHFYGKLAAEDLGEPLLLPAPPTPLTAAERAAAVRNPGLDRALHLIAIGLRDEGVREWNFTLRGMNDRELLAAADLACQREVWDRCINTSDRTRSEVDIAQRFPMPMRSDVERHATQIGLDTAYVYGLIRQESRFIMDARSGAGASGLMQIMPSTARWTARRIGLPYTPDLITDRDVNLRLGTQYLKLVLDDFEGSQAMAAAAYNAGPNRPRRWRDGPVLEPAIWAENIPFDETRDYVKKVLSNATYYASLITGQTQSLKARLGRAIGPRDALAAPSNLELP